MFALRRWTEASGRLMKGAVQRGNLDVEVAHRTNTNGWAGTQFGYSGDPELTDVVRTIEQRAAELVQIPLDLTEGMQVRSNQP